MNLRLLRSIAVALSSLAAIAMVICSVFFYSGAEAINPNKIRLFAISMGAIMALVLVCNALLLSSKQYWKSANENFTDSMDIHASNQKYKAAIARLTVLCAREEDASVKLRAEACLKELSEAQGNGGQIYRSDLTRISAKYGFSVK